MKPTAALSALIAAALLSAVAPTARAQVLGTASAYNLFTLGDASNRNVDIFGRVAVGGNADFQNYTIGTKSGINSGVGNSIYAVVGGNYTNSSGTVHGSIAAGGNVVHTTPTVFGNISAGGSVTLGGDGTVNGAVRYGATYNRGNTTVGGTATQGASSLPVDFAAEAAFLENRSRALAQLSGNGSANITPWGQIHLSGTGAQNVYSISYSQLAAVNTFTINADAHATVIVNVTGGAGTTFTVPNTGIAQVSGTSTSKVLFNFVDATAFNLSSFNGSVLAPFAAITGSSGGFNGNLIARNFAGNGLELHSLNPNNLGENVLFNGTVTNLGAGVPGPDPVPEPGAVVTGLTMAGMTGLGLLRGRRRAAARKTA